MLNSDLTSFNGVFSWRHVERELRWLMDWSGKFTTPHGRCVHWGRHAPNWPYGHQFHPSAIVTTNVSGWEESRAHNEVRGANIKYSPLSAIHKASAQHKTRFTCLFRCIVRTNCDICFEALVFIRKYAQWGDLWLPTLFCCSSRVISMITYPMRYKCPRFAFHCKIVFRWATSWAQGTLLITRLFWNLILNGRSFRNQFSDADVRIRTKQFRPPSHAFDTCQLARPVSICSWRISTMITYPLRYNFSGLAMHSQIISGERTVDWRTGY